MKTTKKFFPEEIILNNLIVGPETVKVPILGGMDEEITDILVFSLKAQKNSSVELHFYYDTKEYINIQLTFENMENFIMGEYIEELYEKQRNQQTSILKQALILIEDNKDLVVYSKSIEKELQNSKNDLSFDSIMN